LKEIFLDL